MASVCGGKWDGGGGGDVECDPGNERRVERAAGTECGFQSSRRLLHRRVSTWTWAGENRVLAGADEFAGHAGAGKDDAGKRDGLARGVGAVCEHGDRFEGE